MDEVIKTRNYQRYIMKDGTINICRTCHRPGKSFRHIVSGSFHLANGEYLQKMEVPCCMENPTFILENSCALLYWNRSIITDKYIVANIPDIVLVERVARRAVIVGITISHMMMLS